MNRGYAPYTTARVYTCPYLITLLLIKAKAYCLHHTYGNDWNRNPGQVYVLDFQLGKCMRVSFLPWPLLRPLFNINTRYVGTLTKLNISYNAVYWFDCMYRVFSDNLAINVTNFKGYSWTTKSTKKFLLIPDNKEDFFFFLLKLKFSS